MTIKEYLKIEFPKDLASIKFNRPNSVIHSNPESFKIDRNTIYFGGPDWINLDNDIVHIKNEHHQYFFLCLFTVVIIDLTMFTHFKEHYNSFRSKTMYPKFGWTGFGTHYENPKKLLNIPQQKGLIEESKIINNLDEYISLLRNECDFFFENHLSQIKTDDFLNALLSDKDFRVNESDKNSIFEIIYDTLHDYQKLL